VAENLNGPEKAAILLLSLGEKFASQVIRNLDAHEVHRLGAYMSRVKDYTMDQIDKVLEEYHQKAYQAQQGVPIANEDYVKKLILGSLGEERARPILEKLSSSHHQVDLSFVRDIDPVNLVNFIKMEHPQTIALIMSYVSPSNAAQLLSLLPEQLRAEVVIRMASLESVDTGMVTEIASVIEREVKAGGAVSDSHKVSGLQTVAEIMNNLDKSVSVELLSFLEEKDKELTTEIQELMFVFDDLVTIDDRGIQTILKNIENDKLIVALRTASDEIKEKIFRNLSTRAAQMIQEEIEVMGPIRISEVEAAQKEIAAVARKLEEDGEIVISKGEGDIVV